MSVARRWRARSSAKVAAWSLSSRCAALQPDVDLTPRLREQTVTFGDGGGGDAGFFRGDFLGAALAQRDNLAGQRLHLAIDFGELRRGRAVQLGGVDQILADLARSACQILGERRAQKVVETAAQDQEVERRPQQSRQTAVLARACSPACGGRLMAGRRLCRRVRLGRLGRDRCRGEGEGRGQ